MKDVIWYTTVAVVVALFGLLAYYGGLAMAEAVSTGAGIAYAMAVAAAATVAAVTAIK